MPRGHRPADDRRQPREPAEPAERRPEWDALLARSRADPSMKARSHGERAETTARRRRA